MHRTTARRWTLAGAVVALAATAGITYPRLADRFGADPTATVPAAAAAEQRITILGAGDILVHPPTWQQAAADAAAAGQPGSYVFDPLFDDVRATVSSADLALCHMEAPMGPGRPQDFPRFNAPTTLAAAVARTGFDGCSTASNHSLDQGPGGVAANLAALDAAGLKHTGTARTRAEAMRPTIYDVRGVKIGHLSYAYGLNPGTARPAGKQWMANVIDVPAILAAAARLKAAGAAIIVLSAHWGIERQHDINRQQLTAARALLASPNIDMIIGHHAHVVQPAEKINGKWVFYGVGNLVARHDFPIPDNKEGVLPRVTFTPTGDGHWQAVDAEAVPIWLSIEPRIVVNNITAAMTRMPAMDARRRKYAAAYDRIRGHLDRRGAIASGLQLPAPPDGAR